MFATQLSDFDAKHEEINGHLERCEPLFNRVENVMKSVAAEQMQTPEFAAAVTHCLSCGQNRSLYPGMHSLPPWHLDEDATTPGIITFKRGENGVFRTVRSRPTSPVRSRPTSPTRSRPTSPVKFSQSGDVESTMNHSGLSAAAGAAHVACRVAGGVGTPRPKSPRRLRPSKMITPVVDRALRHRRASVP